MGGAAFLGLSLISGSKLVAFLAVVSHLSHWWFLSFVEKYVARRGNGHIDASPDDQLRAGLICRNCTANAFERMEA